MFSMKGGFLPEDPQGVKLIVPVGRYGTIEDIAYTAVFLSTNAASFLSGRIGLTITYPSRNNRCRRRRSVAWSRTFLSHAEKLCVQEKRKGEERVQGWSREAVNAGRKLFYTHVTVRCFKKRSAPKMVFHELGHQFAHDQPMNQLSLSYTQLLNPKKGSPKSSGLQEEEDRQTLYKAVISGDLTTVQQLVKTGTDVNVADAHGKSALMAASEAGECISFDSANTQNITANSDFCETLPFIELNMHL